MIETSTKPDPGRVAWSLVLACLVQLVMPTPQALAQSRNVTVVGQIGGSCLTIAGQNGYAYLGEGLSLVVLNISNPDKPLRVGQLRLKSLVRRLVLSGKTIFAALGGELVIIDVSSPTAPVLKGYYDMEGQTIAGLAATGATVYLGGSNSFQVVDAANPAAPRLLGSLPLSTTDLALTDGLACIVDEDGSLRVIDVSNSIRPRLRGTLAGLYANQIAAAGHTAYLAISDIQNDILQVVDLSNPDSPVLKGYSTEFNFITDLAAAGTSVYVMDSAGLHILNVADPRVLQPIGELTLSYWARMLTVVGSLALVFDDKDGFEIVDVSTPARPRLRGRDVSLGMSGSLEVSGGRAYVTNGLRGMAILNVADPARPVPSGVYPATGLSGKPAVAGRYAYLPAEFRMEIVDVGNPATPRLISTYPTPEVSWAVKVAGNLAYLVYGFDREPTAMEIVDVSAPALPKRKGIYALPLGERWSEDLVLGGNYAYLAEHWGNIQVVDVSNPAAPSPKGRYQYPIDYYYYHDLALKGNWLYAAFDWVRGEYGIDVFNVADPNNPRWAGSYSDYRVPGVGRAVTVAGNNLYGSLGAAGLGIFDLGVPERPLLIGGYGTSTFAEDVVTTGGLIYLSDGDLGLAVLRQLAASVKVTSMSLRNLGIVRAQAGTELYTDRGITLKNTVPPLLMDQLMIQLPDDARDTTTSNFLSFQIDRMAEISVAVDARRAAIPDWLQGWSRLTDTLTTSDPLSPNRTIYRKVFPKGLVTLGPNRTQSMPRGYRMYNVIVRPYNNAVQGWMYF